MGRVIRAQRKGAGGVFKVSRIALGDTMELRVEEMGFKIDEHGC